MNILTGVAINSYFHSTNWENPCSAQQELLLCSQCWQIDMKCLLLQRTWIRPLMGFRVVFLCSPSASVCLPSNKRGRETELHGSKGTLFLWLGIHLLQKSMEILAGIFLLPQEASRAFWFSHWIVIVPWSF